MRGKTRARRMLGFFQDNARRGRIQKCRSRRALAEALEPVLAKLESIGSLTDSERRELRLIPKTDSADSVE